MIMTVPAHIINMKDMLFKPTAYDIRAYVGEPGSFFGADAVLTPTAMEIAGALMGSMIYTLRDDRSIGLQPGDAVVIGHDNGPTSKQLSDAFSKGLIGQGVDVYCVGVASSGQVYHNQQQLSAQGHAQITRSHVEVTVNGVKFAVGGSGIHTYLLKQMNDAVASGTIGREAPQGKVFDRAVEAKELYIRRMIERYGAYFRDNRRQIAVNLFGGTAVEYKEMFRQILGADTVILGSDLDVNDGALLADPTRKEMLAQVPGFADMLKRGMRIYSFDLDADRLSVSEGVRALDVTGAGHYLGNDLAYILACYKLTKAVPAFIAGLKDNIPRETLDKIHELCTTVYVDPRYSSAVQAYVLRNGGRSAYLRKGHSLWKEAMSANLAELAALAGYGGTEGFVRGAAYRDIQIEASLHLFASDIDDGTVRDDGLESVFILEKIFDELGIRRLADFYLSIPKRFVTKEIRTGSVSNDIKEKVTRHVIEGLKKTFSRSGYDVVEFDGQLRVDWSTGFLMYGMSNTSPKLTFMAEGATVEERNNTLAYILALHNAAKADYGDTLPLDTDENAFFKEDSSFDMAKPDNIGLSDPRAAAFIEAHNL